MDILTRCQKRHRTELHRKRHPLHTLRCVGQKRSACSRVFQASVSAQRLESSRKWGSPCTTVRARRTWPRGLGSAQGITNVWARACQGKHAQAILGDDACVFRRLMLPLIRSAVLWENRLVVLLHDEGPHERLWLSLTVSWSFCLTL